MGRVWENVRVWWIMLDAQIKQQVIIYGALFIYLILVACFDRVTKTLPDKGGEYSPPSRPNIIYIPVPDFSLSLDPKGTYPR